MTIKVKVADVATTAPVELKMTDRSGAHVELLVAFADRPPLRHAFDFSMGDVVVPLDNLAPGKNKCTFIVQAFWHAQSLNRAYHAELSVAGTVVASAKGSIPKSRTNDVGFGDFTITVEGAS